MYYFACIDFSVPLIMSCVMTSQLTVLWKVCRVSYEWTKAVSWMVVWMYSD